MTYATLLLTRRATLAGALAFGFALAVPGAAAAAEADISDIDAFERQQADEMIIVDIRTPPEWAETGVATGAVTIDMQDPEFIPKLVALRTENQDKGIALICASSNRSGQAQRLLSQSGFDRLYSVFGGMTGNGQVAGWIADGLPTEKCC
ncbi:MAG: rhodanese-like domain-containing protein [Alphaproteobacteria bacterium]|nr:rhodanese-like domain-containing protein [Alphaproteobacteria bacterium]